MLEELIPRVGRKTAQATRRVEPLSVAQIEGEQDVRVHLRMQEFGRVLGGGIVPGSVVLIGGDPGIGKSTLLLQLALDVAADSSVLYVSGEESPRQLKSRILRISGQRQVPDSLRVLTETALEAIIGLVEVDQPSVLILDSIQTMTLDEVSSSAGSISQVRECAARIQQVAKSTDVAVFLVGHVTKQGAIAGPKVLEHIVDTVLYLEGDQHHVYRLLRSVKNRFGPTTEVGVFEMRSEGMLEVLNPSEAFLAERMVNAPGSAIAVTMEGTRPLLVEVQGLTSPTSFGHPRRTANGVDFNRLLLNIAVLTRRAGVRLAEQDVFVNVVGGMRVSEPAADLALAAAIASSVRDQALPADTALIGEVGLSGELRAVPQLEARLTEASKLGFNRVIVPKRVGQTPAAPAGLQVVQARSVQEAFQHLFSY
jgi:DNA repair protein RadA/Sms